MTHRTTTQLAILLFAAAGALSAQTRQFPQSGRALGADVALTASVRLGDVDGDGDLDIVVANGRHWPQQNLVYLNGGDAIFNLSRRLGEERATSYAAPLADFDGDGDLDVVVGNDRVRKLVLWNDGRGHFTPGPTIGPDSANTRNITVADLNGDDAPDIIIVNRNGTNTLHFNDGAGSFSAGSPIGTGSDATIDIAAADVDLDGDLDLVLANREAQPNTIYFNDGHGQFPRHRTFGTGNDNTRAVAIADPDGRREGGRTGGREGRKRPRRRRLLRHSVANSTARTMPTRTAHVGGTVPPSRLPALPPHLLDSTPITLHSRPVPEHLEPRVPSQSEDPRRV